MLYERNLRALFLDNEWKLVAESSNKKPFVVNQMIWTQQQRLEDIWKSFVLIQDESVFAIIAIVGKINAGNIETWIQQTCQNIISYWTTKTNEPLDNDIIHSICTGKVFHVQDPQPWFFIFHLSEAFTQIYNDQHPLLKKEEKEQQQQQKTKEEKISEMFQQDYDRLYKQLNREYCKSKLFDAAESIGLHLEHEMKKPEMLDHLIRYALSRNLVSF